MSRFYVTLPSNSSAEYYPDNTVARYTTKLASSIELEGDWEVGLAEISIPSAVENVVRDQCYYYVYVEDSFVRKIVLPPGNHKEIHSLLDVMHEEQYRQMQLPGLVVTFSYEDGKISVEIAHTRISVQFSRDLAHMLALDESVRYSQNITSTRPASLVDGVIHSVYVYCDILEHVAVGDTRAPLLRIIDKPRKSFGNVHQMLNPILHIPLQKKRFDTVEINIMTDTGVPVPFLGGKAFVVLEFRRVVHPLFAI